MIIKNGVYIGCGAIILGDISIGENVCIAAHGVVHCDVDENKIVAGLVK